MPGVEGVNFIRPSEVTGAAQTEPGRVVANVFRHFGHGKLRLEPRRERGRIEAIRLVAAGPGSPGRGESLPPDKGHEPARPQHAEGQPLVGAQDLHQVLLFQGPNRDDQPAAGRELRHQ